MRPKVLLLAALLLTCRCSSSGSSKPATAPRFDAEEIARATGTASPYLDGVRAETEETMPRPPEPRPAEPAARVEPPDAGVEEVDAAPPPDASSGPLEDAGNPLSDSDAHAR